MDEAPHPDPYHGLFRLLPDPQGVRRLMPDASPPASIPDPGTGHPLRISTVEGGAQAFCPSCSRLAQGGFVSFVADLRLAYACPECRQLVWVRGA